MRKAFIMCLGLLAACSGVEPRSAEAPDTQIPPASYGTKRIALTYDDAPRGDGPVMTGAERTEAFLDELARADIPPVAIFVTTQGFATEGGRERIEAYAKAGHLIANHSHTHPWASRTNVGVYLADIDRAEAELDGLPNRRPWFRFPFLDEGGYDQDKTVARAKRDALREGLAARGLLSGYVTVDTFDWHLADLWRQALEEGREVDREALQDVYVAMVVEAAEHYDSLARDALGRRPAQVLLLHENDLAAEFTDEAVAGLRQAGWEIVSPDAAFADPIMDVAPDTLFSGMGRIAAIAHDTGPRDPEVFDHWSADREGLEARAMAAGAFEKTR